MRAPHLYLITDRHATLGRPLLDVVDEALAAVARAPALQSEPWRVAVQLRDKDLSAKALWEIAGPLRKICHRHQATLFINGRVDVALAVGANGVHLGVGALPVAAVRAMAPELAVAVSTHNHADIVQSQLAGADFAVFGPVYETPSKAGILSPVGLSGLSAAAALGLPLLALGGVDETKAESCLKAGAVGVACIRLWLSASSPSEALVSLLTFLKQGVES